MIWLIIIAVLVIAAIVTAYTIPNESINTKKLPNNRP